MLKETNAHIFKTIYFVSKEVGCRAYMVGGFVRNLLLGINSEDFDFVIEGDSLYFAEKVAEKLGNKKVVKFPRFKTAKVKYRDTDIEFVSARSEIYNENSRNPKVKESTIEEDLSRRDFTINTMAMEVVSDGLSEIIDPFNGRKDLERKILKTPLEPDVTYRDDPLRMLRGIRFASTLGLKIDTVSFQAISKNIHRIEIVSVERITDEFFKMISSKSPVKAIWLLDRSGLLKLIFPELVDLKGIDQVEGIGHKDNFIHTLKVLNNISKATNKKELRIAALFHDIGKFKTKYFKKETGWTFHGHDEYGSKLFKKIATRLKWSNDLTEYVSKIIRLHHRPISLAKDEVTDSGVRRLLFEGGDDVDDLLLLCRADITTANKNKLKKYLDNYDKLSHKLLEVEKKDELRNFKPAVDGKDIMKIFSLKEGIEVGRIKKKILNAVLNGDIENNRVSALKFLDKLKDNEERKIK